MKKLGLTALAAALASLSLASVASADATGVANTTTTPSSLDFGDQAPGTASAVKTVTVSVPCFYVLDGRGWGGGISCSAPGKVDAINVSGPFTQTNDCVLPISNNAIDGSLVTCTVSIRFEPTTTGPQTGSLDLSSYGDIHAYTVALNGNGVVAPAPKPGDKGDKGAKGTDGTTGGSAGTVAAKCKKGKKAKKGAAKSKKCKVKKRR